MTAAAVRLATVLSECGRANEHRQPCRLFHPGISPR
jgi:hypothetical protein